MVAHSDGSLLFTCNNKKTIKIGESFRLNIGRTHGIFNSVVISFKTKGLLMISNSLHIIMWQFPYFPHILSRILWSEKPLFHNNVCYIINTIKKHFWKHILSLRANVWIFNCSVNLIEHSWCSQSFPAISYWDCFKDHKARAHWCSYQELHYTTRKIKMLSKLIQWNGDRCM